MRVFLALALAVGSLLATANAQAHTPTATHASRLDSAATVATISCTAEVAAFTGPVVSIRPSGSVRPSFGGFRSVPAYHGFSPTPSRTFTLSTRPATTPSRPATSVPIWKSTPVGRPAPPQVVHHYYGTSGGGGLSVGEALMLHQALSSQGHSAPQTSLTSYGLQPGTDPSGYSPATAAPEQPSHFWRNTGLFLIIAALGYGIYRYRRNQQLRAGSY